MVEISPIIAEHAAWVKDIAESSLPMRSNRSLLAWLALPVAGVTNLVLGWYFLTSYLERRKPAE